MDPSRSGPSSGSLPPKSHISWRQATKMFFAGDRLSNATDELDIHLDNIFVNDADIRSKKDYHVV